MKHPPVISRPVAIDARLAAAALAREPGTLLWGSPWAGPSDPRAALLFRPRWILRSEGSRPVWSGDVPWPRPPETLDADLPLSLASAWRQTRAASRPVFAGLAGFLAYDLGPAACGARHPVPPPFDLPDVWLGAYDTALVFGADASCELVVADLAPLVAARVPLEERLEEALEVLGHAVRRPVRPAAIATTNDPVPPDPHWHRRAVETIHRHLRAGDAYQINLTAHTTAATDADPWAVFEAETRRNPAAFSAYLKTEDAAVTSHSPERLLRVRGDTADTLPIKGTIQAGPGDLDRLTASAKDRAEHVMIVDLCRNDLGRVCEYGSVHVPELMEALRLRGLVHLVSRIEGRLRPEGRAHALGSLFPGGSITGAPKRRAMEIITSVEQCRRGPYTGSIGYVDRLGATDWNIAIRTAVWQNGNVAFGSGGGIVLDSDADAEYAETLLKASSFFRTLSQAGQPRPVSAMRGVES
jgi:para-aminobenzoate synthetase component 1